MKKTILTLVVLLASSIAFAYPPNYTTPRGSAFIPRDVYTSRPNLYGGQTYYSRGGVYSSRRNLFGGYNYYDQRGVMTDRSMRGVGGMERYQHFNRR